MTETLENAKYPFKITFDPDFDWLGLTFRVELKRKLDTKEQEKLETTINTWAQTGIEKGYGEGQMHYLDSDFTRQENYFEFFADMGESDEKAVEELFGRLSDLNFITGINLGFGD